MIIAKLPIPTSERPSIVLSGPWDITMLIRPGVIRASCGDGTCEITDGTQTRVFTSIWNDAPRVVTFTFHNSSAETIEHLALTDLEVSELVAVVDYHDVATNAGTKAGLIKAIERELNL